MSARAVRAITPTTARRLAVSAQLLAGPRPAADRQGLLAVVRRLGCLQLDPIGVVARSHQLVLASRVGTYDPADVDALLYEERSLFEYWAHAASIVPTEDYAIHAEMMRRFRSRKKKGTRIAWMEENDALRRVIMRRLRAEGPLPSRAFEDEARTDWSSSGWNSGRNVDRMLDFLWVEGRIAVAGRDVRGRIWTVAERHFPADIRSARLRPAEVVRVGAERALRALGVGRALEVRQHFIRGRYPGLPAVLATLARRERIVPVQIRDGTRTLPGTWYVHAEELPLLDAIEAGRWEPRAALLSPFDNLLCDRRRAELLFDFHFRMEIYVPAKLRKYGYYVMPILHGDTVVGRADPAFDRKSRTLELKALHAEPGFGGRADVGEAVAGAVARLATFLGARTLRVPRRAPAAWRRPLAGSLG